MITVMLIDDDPTDLLINKKLIEYSGFSSNLLACDSVEKALDILDLLIKEERQDEMPDCIFLDLQMPLQTGQDFIIAFQPYIPLTSKKVYIYILSNFTFDFPTQITDFIDGHFVKPLNLDILEQIQKAVIIKQS